MPALPVVHSTIVIPGCRSPRSSASREHVRVDPVLHRAGGAVPLDLHEQLDVVGRHACGASRAGCVRSRPAACRRPGGSCPTRSTSALPPPACPQAVSRRRPSAFHVSEPARDGAGGLHGEPARPAAGPPGASGTQAPSTDRAGDHLAVGAADGRGHRVQPFLELLERLRVAPDADVAELRDQARRRRRSWTPSGARAGAPAGGRGRRRACWRAAPCRSTCNAAACCARPSSR